MSPDLSSVRTVLFVPGDRPDRIAKALATSADIVCIDLEDSIPAEGKAAARTTVAEAVASAPLERVAVRVNPLASRAGLEDLVALASASVSAQLVFVPKVQVAEELSIIAGALGNPLLGMVPLIESPEGLFNVGAIARMPGCAALMLGGADLAADIGATLEWESLIWARLQIVQAAARARVPAIDMPFVDVNDTAGLLEETRRVKALGYAAKAAIHPGQLAGIQSAFRPTDDELEQARSAVAAFRAARGRAVAFKGRLLDAPIVRQYERTLATSGGQHE